MNPLMLVFVVTLVLTGATFSFLLLRASAPARMREAINIEAGRRARHVLRSGG